MKKQIYWGGGIDEPIPRGNGGAVLNELRQRMTLEAIAQIRKNATHRLFYLEAPTGGGKTNISMLVAAELLKLNPELNKVFYVFPFTTLITQTNKAILETWGLTTDEVALMQSKAGFQEKYGNKETENGDGEELEDGKYGKDKLNYLSNLFGFYPICLMTHIRFFDMLKSNEKDTIYLMHRLANAIVILDEMQSYNPELWAKMIYLIEQYAHFFNIRFILMSATLPKIDTLIQDKLLTSTFVELLPKPERFFTNPNFAQRVQFNFELLENYSRGIDLDTLANYVIQKSNEYAQNSEFKSVHTIIEFIFKKSATEFKTVIENLQHGFDAIFVLSGTILEPRRREIINFLKNSESRNQNILLITTQVVEAGVDIDMDLGFKNQSLLDSDEQLAGRVNRNINKPRCEVYLFKKDESMILYKNDYRFTAMRNQITIEEQKKILEQKTFSHLYGLVLKRIQQNNRNPIIENVENTFIEYFKTLDYKAINDNFVLIGGDNVSIFVPLDLPIKVESENSKKDVLMYEDVFSEQEIKLAKEIGALTEHQTICGATIWAFYKQIIENKNGDFVSRIVSLKTIQGVLAKFTFSVFYSDKLESTTRQFRNVDLEFKRYWYWNEMALYTIENGLMTNQFNDVDYHIL